MKDGHHHRRYVDGEVEPEGPDEAEHQQHHLEIAVLAHIAESVGKASSRALALHMMELGGTDHAEREEHGDERDGVDDEDPTRSDRADHETGDGGPDHSRAIEAGGVESNGIREIGFTDEVRDERL